MKSGVSLNETMQHQINENNMDYLLTRLLIITRQANDIETHYLFKIAIATDLPTLIFPWNANHCLNPAAFAIPLFALQDAIRYLFL